LKGAQIKFRREEFAGDTVHTAMSKLCIGVGKSKY
jgi:hypothetical protein